MNHSYHKTNPELTEYIQMVLVLERSDHSESADLPLFTNGMPALFCKKIKGKHHLTLYGQSVPAKEWDIKEDENIIAFFFKPFALTTIFDLSATELKDKPLDLNLWNAHKTMALAMQFASDSIEDHIETLNNFILSQLHANRQKCEMIRILL